MFYSLYMNSKTLIKKIICVIMMIIIYLSFMYHISFHIYISVNYHTMNPYKLKHVPTGMYYQPHKYHGSNLSKRGKIYQTTVHGLSSAIRSNYATFIVYCENNSIIHKLTKDKIVYVDCQYSRGQVMGETSISDWIVEEI